MASKERYPEEETVIAVLQVPMAPLALSESLRRAPRAYFRFEQVALCDSDGGVPIWIGGHRRERIEDALEGDPAVRSYTRLHQRKSEWLYELAFDDGERCVQELIIEHEGSLLSARGAGGTWTLMVRFPCRARFSEAYDAVREQGIDATCDKIKTCTSPHQEPVLSDAQHEAIEKAISLGYFDVPRGVTLEELAAAIGISHQAVSERLRRAEKEVFSSLIHDQSRTPKKVDYTAV